MTNLSFEAFSRIYKDQANEEGYESYLRVMDRIRKSLPFPDCVGMTQDQIEKKLQIDEYTRWLATKKEMSLSAQLTRFSQFAENDPVLPQLAEVEKVYKNGNLHQDYTRLKGRIGMYINNHPKRKEVTASQLKHIFDTLVIGYFMEERPVRQVKKLFELPEKGFYEIIDEAFEERAVKNNATAKL